MKKFEFVTEDTIEVGTTTLTRIRALIDIPRYGVEVGDLGGYLEKEENLSHDGDAWVYDNARVFGDARVYDDAWVYGDACVFGDACVYGTARVFGDAHVYGDARIETRDQIAWFSNVGTEHGTLTAYLTKTGEIELTRGCFRGTIEEFTIASKQKHDDYIFKEYQLLIEMIKLRFSRPKP